MPRSFSRDLHERRHARASLLFAAEGPQAYRRQLLQLAALTGETWPARPSL